MPHCSQFLNNASLFFRIVNVSLILIDIKSKIIDKNLLNLIILFYLSIILFYFTQLVTQFRIYFTKQVSEVNLLLKL
jgi:hypothetical protein